MRRRRVFIPFMISFICIAVAACLFLYQNAQANIASLPEFNQIVSRYYSQVVQTRSEEHDFYESLRKDARAFYDFSKKLQNTEDYMREAHLIENLSTKLMKASYDNDRSLCAEVLSEMTSISEVNVHDSVNADFLNQ